MSRVRQVQLVLVANAVPKATLVRLENLEEMDVMATVENL